MPTTNTRERLIDAGRARFYRDGFRNVGIDQILDDVGISKTAFYKHFASKDDLMLEVLASTDRWLQQTFRDLVRQHGGESAVGQLRALFDVVEQVIKVPDFHGCIFVHAAMEFPLQHDPAHEAAASNKLAIQRFIFELAERAGVAEPDVMAQELCLIIEGAYVTYSVAREQKNLAVARRVADRTIDTHLATVNRK